MCPIFKNTNISRDDIGDFMKAYAEEHNIMAQPRRSLIESMKGEKILLATPLLKWYLEHGLEVTKVHQVVEFTPVPCFKPFGDAVSDARRAGDADSRKAIIADTMKLVSFCFFFLWVIGKGKKASFIGNKHIQVLFLLLLNLSIYLSIYIYMGHNITEDNYEVESCKKTIKLNLSIQVSFFLCISMLSYACCSFIVIF